MSINTGENRRRFLAYFSGIGLGTSLLPGALWAEMQQDGEAPPRVTEDMLKSALAVAGLSFGEEERKAMLDGVNRNLTGFEEVRKLDIPNDVAPPFYFSPMTPGMKVNRTHEPLRFSAQSVKRPANHRRRRVLAGGAARAVAQDPAGHVARADRDVSRRVCINTTPS